MLKNRLSEYVRWAAAGEIVLVTDRGHVVAELVPPREDRNPLLADELLTDAIRQGWLSPAIGSDSGAPPRRPMARLEGLLADLAVDRSER